MKFENPFECQGNWYKANLHTHTAASDGEFPLQQRIDQYRSRDYNVLAVTDHAVTHDVAGLSTDDLLVISGMEAHPNCTLDGSTFHFVCLNVPDGLCFDESTVAQAGIDEVKRHGAAA